MDHTITTIGTTDRGTDGTGPIGAFIDTTGGITIKRYDLC